MSDFDLSQFAPASAPEPSPAASAPAAPAGHKVGDLVRFTYEGHNGKVTDAGIVVAREVYPARTLEDGTAIPEQPHVVVAWLRDLSDPLPEGLVTSD